MMNGAGTRQGLDYGVPAAMSLIQNVVPTGRALANGYRQEVVNGFEPEQPRYTPLNEDGRQSSPMVDLKDPIQVHLLTETALSDSREWVILSQEEVDELKKQSQSLMQRIEQTRANLAIQSKYRDAAISMAKLYSPGRRGSGGDAGRENRETEAEAERMACEKRCEELASELFLLEKRVMEPQRKLLQHTAGILQLTHGASQRKKAQHQLNDGGQSMHGGGGGGGGGMPGSPESLYTYSHGGRDSLDNSSVRDTVFDDRALYLPIDQPLDAMGRTLEIPQKSPVRKEAKELREESDRLRDEATRLQAECDGLRAAHDSLRLELAALQREKAEHQRAVADAERQVEDLTGRLASAQQEQAARALADARQAETSSLLSQIAGRVAAVNGQVRQMLPAAAAASLPPPPLPEKDAASSQDGVAAQLDWLQASLPAIESEMSRGADDALASTSDRQAADQVNATLAGLWDMILSGFAAQRQQREERKASRRQMGLVEDEEDEEEQLTTTGDLDEPYSLAAFSTKVQWLYQQTVKLQEHKSVLKRQIKQQRELNNKSDAEKDQELEAKTADLQRAQRAAEDAQSQMARLLTELSEAQEAIMAKDAVVARAEAQLQATRSQVQAGQAEQDARLQQAESKVAVLETQAAEGQAALAALKARVADSEAAVAARQAALATAEGSVAALTAQLREATEAQQAAEARAVQAAQEARGKDEDLERLNAMVVELKTEATIAKAELDGAYGSRAQRAADVAKQVTSTQRNELQTEVDKLRAELAGTLQEYEELTKDSMAAERERLDVEAQLDEAQSARAALEAEVRSLRDKLEAEVGALKEQLDGERLKAVGSAAGGGRAGASMLSEQFRATMKEERKKFQEELRNEQSIRRKLEEEVRVLKRAAGPGKSPLSPP